MYRIIQTTTFLISVFSCFLSTASYAVDCASVNLSMLLDNYQNSTHWNVENAAGTEIASGSGYQQQQSINETLCLTPGNYLFTVFDGFGVEDCCLDARGAYTITINGTEAAAVIETNTTAYVDISISADDLISEASYYTGVSGLTGYPLKTALHNIIKSHNDQGYSAVWDFIAANDLDLYYDNTNTVLDIYSENPTGNDPYSFVPRSNQCGNYNSEGDCYNREHSFPRSWFNSGDPMFSDIHQLFPTDGRVNEMRSNFAYGEVDASSFTSQNGSKLGNNVTEGYSSTVFEPIDEFKGDIARAQLYMATRYQDKIAGWETNNSRGNVALDGSSDRGYEPWYVELLVSWHQQDPVSDKERARNTAAHAYQGNRNPFIDNPQWVEMIWGESD